MDFKKLLKVAAGLQCFSPGMITAGHDLDQIRVQLSRWVASGRVVRIHKGWYTLNEPFRHVRLDMAVIACTIKEGVYLSLQSALAFHGMIPEYVAETTCVTTGRPHLLDTPLGRIRYRHMKGDVFFGYAQVSSGPQSAYVAVPGKALLDLLYLTPGSEHSAYLKELRLQGTENLDLPELQRMATRFGAPRLVRAVDVLGGLVDQWSDRK
jgi:predicted transcriptional regulator of viral defense system